MLVFSVPDDSDLPDVAAFGEHKHVAAFLLYVDDFLAAGPRDILQPLLIRLLDVWKGSNPELLGRQPGDVDTMRFLGLAQLSWAQKKVHGLCTRRATSTPSFNRCLTQNASKIVEPLVNLNHSPTSLMSNYMHRKHVSSIHHFNQDRILWNIRQSCG